MEAAATILHADMDAFYASVEQLLDLSLRNKPIAVSGGVVLARPTKQGRLVSAVACLPGGPTSSARN
jgi:nucleotidyltransferase/DNA polymerase involved in DNA repair